MIYEVSEEQISDFQTDQIAFYNKSDVFVGGIAQVNPTTHKFTTPSNAKYIGLSVKPENLSSFMLAKASEYPTAYEPYFEKLPLLKINYLFQFSFFLQHPCIKVW